MSDVSSRNVYRVGIEVRVGAAVWGLLGAWLFADVIRSIVSPRFSEAVHSRLPTAAFALLTTFGAAAISLAFLYIAFKELIAPGCYRGVVSAVSFKAGSRRRAVLVIKGRRVTIVVNAKLEHMIALDSLVGRLVTLRTGAFGHVLQMELDSE